MSVIEALMVPMIIFLIFVAPLWLILHYRSQSKAAKILSAEEQQTLEQLAAVAERMEGRLASLEKILDTDDPRWKDKLP
ncbi:MAG: envelope stress response membrane protein PspB [Rhodospirillaceae bacterium]|nr:envelope stress response membrane protein PspB [Rhodospirillaceae bacterium]